MKKFLFILGLVLGCFQSLQAAPVVEIAQNGKALLTIHVKTNADSDTRQAAQTLADYLQKISTATFAVQSREEGRTINVGTAADFPRYKTAFDLSDPLNDEDYILKTHESGIDIIGATSKGVNHAVWGFLYRLGHRQFFAGPHWEIVPRSENLSLQVDTREHPDFFWRTIWSAEPVHREWLRPEVRPYRNKFRDEWNRWAQVNRLGGAIKVRSQHADSQIIGAFKDEFAAHPEYFALVNGERRNKGTHLLFCYSNAQLQQLIVRYALDYFEKNLQEECVSIEPGDSYRWCECEQCAQMGSPSDRLVVLANRVIAAVREKNPRKFVSFYSYQAHADPPSLKLSPGVIVPVATHLAMGKVKSFEERVAGWREAGALTGVREYYSVNIWENGIPGTSAASRVEEIARKTARYHQIGLGMLNAESTDGWGLNGLGYYVASRLLWDVKAAGNVDGIIDDFIEKAFGTAAAPMKRFYGMVNGAYGQAVLPLDSSTIGRLYQALDEARQNNSDEAVRQRLDDLVVYVRYLELTCRAWHIPIENQAGLQRALDEIIAHSAKAYGVGTIASNKVLAATGARHWVNKWDPIQYELPAELRMEVVLPQYREGWESRRPFSAEQLQQWVREGIANNPRWKPNWNVKLGAPIGHRAERSSFQMKTFMGSYNRALIFAPQAEQVRISFDQIAAQLTGSQVSEAYYSWQLLDDTGTVVQQGNKIEENKPVIFLAQAERPYYFQIAANARITISGAAVALQTNLSRGRLHLALAPHDLYFHVPPEVEEWKLLLTSMPPGESLRATVSTPQGVQLAQAQTQKLHVPQEMVFQKRSGFLKIHTDKVPGRLLYDYLLTFDKQLSPWVSLNPGLPLMVSER